MKVQDFQSNIGKVVKVVSDPGQDVYLCEGMLATIKDVRLKEASPAAAPEDDLYIIYFDVSSFWEQNKEFETHVWYDKNGVPCLTATEAGCGPEEGIVDYYICTNDDLTEFELSAHYGDIQVELGYN